jgi:hypothetical protein
MLMQQPSSLEQISSSRNILKNQGSNAPLIFILRISIMLQVHQPLQANQQQWVHHSAFQSCRMVGPQNLQ